MAKLDRIALCAQMLEHAFYNTTLSFPEAEKALLLFFTQEEIQKADRYLDIEE